MSEELKEELQTNETEETTAEKPEETMADYEEHFDDANPWNRVTEYMEKQTVLPVKVEGVVNGGVIVMVEGLRGFVPADKSAAPVRRGPAPPPERRLEEPSKSPGPRSAAV